METSGFSWELPNHSNFPKAYYPTTSGCYVYSPPVGYYSQNPSLPVESKPTSVYPPPADYYSQNPPPPMESKPTPMESKPTGCCCFFCKKCFARVGKACCDAVRGCYNASKVCCDGEACCEACCEGCCEGLENLIFED